MPHIWKRSPVIDINNVCLLIGCNTSVVLGSAQTGGHSLNPSDPTLTRKKSKKDDFLPTSLPALSWPIVIVLRSTADIFNHFQPHSSRSGLVVPQTAIYCDLHSGVPPWEGPPNPGAPGVSPGVPRCQRFLEKNAKILKNYIKSLHASKYPTFKL